MTYGYNYVADQRFKVQSNSAIPEGDHIFSFEFTPTGKADIAKGKGVPANIKLFVDGKVDRHWRLASDDSVVTGVGGRGLGRHRCRVAGDD